MRIQDGRLATERSRNYRAAVVLAVLAAGAAGAQTTASFDNSGNGTLTGTYFVRQVLAANINNSTSAIGRAVGIAGTMTFDGKGNYSFSGQIVDSSTGSTASAYTISGTYAVQSNGLMQIQNPIDTTQIDYGGVGAIGPNAIIASATETNGTYNDVFVAIPISSGASSVQGSYQMGFIDFLQGNASQVRDGYFTLAANGSGSFGNTTVNGAMANQGSTAGTQSLSGITYSLTNGSGTLTFPTSGTPLTALVSGQKAFAVSADGNVLLAGAANGFDLMVGIKSLSGSASNSLFQGTYYNAALENDASGLSSGNNSIDSFYGSTLALGQGTLISHERLDFFDSLSYDDTVDGIYNLASAGTYNDGNFLTTLGANGQAALQVGLNNFYTLAVNFQAKQYTGNAPFITPVDVLNAGSFAPITNSVAPGEFVSIFGTNLSNSTQTAQSFPLPTNFGGVQVLVNGVAAPIDYISPTQINFVMPYGTPAFSFAQFQVINGSAQSNMVTLYTAASAPGVFSFTSSGGNNFAPGVGPAAVTHANGSVVTQASPAAAGETLVLYLTGLGAVSPAVGDGLPAPSSPLSHVVDNEIGVDIQDTKFNLYPSTSITYAGLAPGFAGLYQINFVVPSGVPTGLQWVNVGTSDAYTSEAKIYFK
jgi:uncharacterized protein (TIGR03437 family)